MRRPGSIAILGALAAALLTVPLAGSTSTAAPAGADAALAAPVAINARQFTLTTDTTSLAVHVN